MAKTSTSTGLKVFISLNEKIYKTARKADEEFKKNIPLVFDDFLGKWNYRALPQAPKA